MNWENFKRTVYGILKVDAALPLTAFGELSVAEDKTLTQINAVYGLLDNVQTTEGAGGVATTLDHMFDTQTGTNASGVAAIQSRRMLAYKAGQGAKGRFTALFSEGVADNMQIAGLITSEDRLCFGYDGASFGILHAHDGLTEQQNLQITTPSSGSENATITVNAVAYTVPITAGTVQHNAFEIALNLSSQDSLHIYESVDDTVRVTSVLDGAEGLYAFSSGTAVGAWSQVTEGSTLIEEWVPQSDWNGESLKTAIDPTKGNVYQIKFQYLGFGAIDFSVEDRSTGKFVIVHTIKYANNNTMPSLSNPTLRIGWGTQNRGNTSNVTVRGGSAGVFIEGDGLQSDDTRGAVVNATGIGLSETTVMIVRNPATFKGRINRAEMIPILLSIATDTTKTATFVIRKDPTIVGDLDFSDISPNSPMQIAEDNRVVSGGKILMAFEITKESSRTIDLEDKLLHLPFDVISISASVSSGSASNMQASYTWREDF